MLSAQLFGSHGHLVSAGVPHAPRVNVVDQFPVARRAVQAIAEQRRCRSAPEPFLEPPI